MSCNFSYPGRCIVHLHPLTGLLPCRSPIPLLRAGRAATAELSPEACASLLVHAFFCSMPFRNDDISGGMALPYFSFCRAPLQSHPTMFWSPFVSSFIRSDSTRPGPTRPDPIPSSPARSHPVPFDPVQSHPIPSNPIRSHAASTPPLPFHPTPSHSVPTLPDLHGSLLPERHPGSKLGSTQLQKWRCLLHYFGRVATTSPSWSARRVRFERLVGDTSELELEGFWTDAEQELCEVQASAEGTIEDAGTGALQLDFANKNVGGGVLRNGSVQATWKRGGGGQERERVGMERHGVCCAPSHPHPESIQPSPRPISSGLRQEEIRFLICPELIVSRLLVEVLSDNEALLLSGFERFASYSGYASTFAFGGAYVDAAVAASESCHLLAVDATHFRRHERWRQFGPQHLERELNKSYIGFMKPSTLAASDPVTAEAVAALPVCTGNWGCGVFGGDVQLKAMLQLMAASAAGRPLVSYLTFGDGEFASQLRALVERLRRLQCTVGDLANMLIKVSRHPLRCRAPVQFADRPFIGVWGARPT